MKVLHVIDSLGVGGGAEHSLANLLPLLDERGVTSSIATLVPRIGGLQERLSDAGYPLEVLPSTTLPGRVMALRRKVRHERPDLVHAALYNSCLVTRLALLGTGVPSIDTLASTSYDPARTEGIGAAPWKLHIVETVDRISIQRTTRVHAVNHAVADEATRVLHVRPSKISVIPRGRDARGLGEWSAHRRATTRERLGIDGPTPVVLNVGRQDHPKAQAELVRAFGVTAGDVADATLLIAGREGDATPELRRALDEVDLGERIRLLGHRDDVADLYVAADVFAFPSLYEGAAGAIVEAMALRCPVVGSDAVAVAEVLGDGELGVVAKRGDVAALADAMTGLLSDPQRRADLADRGEAEFDRRYRIEAVADATAALYRQVLDEHGHSRS